MKFRSNAPAERPTARANPRHPVADNRLDRDFQAQQPDRKWVADISYIATDQGWLYLAICSRGWSSAGRCSPA